MESPKTRQNKSRRAAPNFISRDIVISAALSVFANNGFHGSSMRQIAAEAKTSLSNLYNYFPSKTHLLAFVLETTARSLADRLESVAKEGTPSERLQVAVAEYVQFIIDQPRTSLVGITEFRYLEGEERDSVLQQRDRTEHLFEQIVVDGSRDGSFSVDNVSLTTRAIVTLCNSMSTWYRESGPLSAKELQSVQANLALGLVRAHVSQ